MKSYKVMVRARGETEYVSNMLRFTTEQQAERYGQDLAARWRTGMEDWRVEPSEDEPTEEAQ